MTTATPTRLAAWLESAWLARYLDRQLAGAELEWFEAYVLDKPELLSVIESDNGVKDALSLASDLGYSRDLSLLGSRGRRGHSTPVSSWLSWAAALVVGVGAGSFGVIAYRSGRQSNEVIVDPTHVTFDTMRGAPSAGRFEHAGNNSPYVLIDVAVPVDAEGIFVEVGDAKSARLTPSADGFVTFLVLRSSLGDDDRAVIRYVLAGQPVRLTLSLDAIRSGHENHQ